MDIPSCALTEDGLREQRARYARLAPQVAGSSRGERELHVDFLPGFDRGTLDEAIAVERECCPFFELRFDEQTSRLTIRVATTEHAPAIGALADAFAIPA